MKHTVKPRAEVHPEVALVPVSVITGVDLSPSVSVTALVTLTASGCVSDWLALL